MYQNDWFLDWHFSNRSELVGVFYFLLLISFDILRTQYGIPISEGFRNNIKEVERFGDRLLKLAFTFYTGNRTVTDWKAEKTTGQHRMLVFWKLKSWDPILCLIELFNRAMMIQRVKVEGMSKPLRVSVCVYQGSALSPLLCVFAITLSYGSTNIQCPIHWSM